MSELMTGSLDTISSFKMMLALIKESIWYIEILYENELDTNTFMKVNWITNPIYQILVLENERIKM